MKRISYILVAMLFVACISQQTKSNNTTEEPAPAEQTTTTEQSEEEEPVEPTDSLAAAEAIATPEPSKEAAPTKVAEELNPNKSIKLIESELVALFVELEKAVGNYKAVNECKDKINERLGIYLRNPQTYRHDVPELKRHMSIVHFPRLGHKIYSYSYYEGGTMGNTFWYFIQYRTKSGEVEYIPFRNDIFFGGGSYEFTEFSYDNKQYYFVKNLSKSDSVSWSYRIAVITIDDGAVNYHTELYPKEINFEPEMERYEAYDDNGEPIPGGDDRPCYFFKACGTDRSNKNVGVEFDPETLTITAWDCADTAESQTGATTKFEWKLGNN